MASRVQDKVLPDAMHFDALQSGSLQAVEQVSNQVWTDLNEHDPGVTLLEALNYGISDLCYRNFHPLVDLLAPEPKAPIAGSGSSDVASPQPPAPIDDGSIFPSGFEPTFALGSGPVTIADWRRAILDLCAVDHVGKPTHFYFDQVEITSEPTNSGVAVDEAQDEFVLANVANVTAITRKGTYSVRAALSRAALQSGDAMDAEAELTRFLRDYRNLGEIFNQPTIVANSGMGSDEYFEIGPRFELELANDAPAAAWILARVLEVVDAFAGNAPLRTSASALVAQGWASERIFDGPPVWHGRIVDLPAQSASSVRTINFADLVDQILAIDGVAGVISIRADPRQSTDNWTVQVPIGHFALLWGHSPADVIAGAKLASNLPGVVLMHRGQVLTVSAQDILSHLDAQAPALDDRVPFALTPGRYRKPSQYYPATGKLPACYGLQRVQADRDGKALARFLLPFEQMAANEFSRLARLRNLLSFVRSPTSRQWGAQWPYSENDPVQPIHHAYGPLLEEFASAKSADAHAELGLIANLLSYFGAKPGESLLARENLGAGSLAGDLIAAQQAFLANVALAGHDKAAAYQPDLPVNAAKRGIPICGLQRRIAARLGLPLPKRNWDPEQDPMPFFLLDNGDLVPGQAELDAYSFGANAPRIIDQVQYLEGDIVSASGGITNATGIRVTVRGPGIALRNGDLLRLIAGDQSAGSVKVVDPVVVSNAQSAIGENKQVIDLALRSVDLASVATQLGQGAPEAHKLFLSPSMRLLSRTFSATKSGDPEGGRVWIDLEPFPSQTKIGSDFIFGDNASGFKKVTVVAIDAWHSRMQVTDDQTYSGGVEILSKATDSVSMVPVDQDPFSLAITLLFDRSLVESFGNPAFTAAEVERIVHEEAPIHLNVGIRWLGQSDFDRFAGFYVAMRQGHGNAASRSAIGVLAGIGGRLPLHDRKLGIGTLKIADNSSAYIISGVADFTMITKDQVLFVPN